MKHPNDSAAHFCEGRAGNGFGEVGILEHWEQTLFCTDGRYVTGAGLTQGAAEDDALIKREQRNAELALRPRDQLQLLYNQVKNERYIGETMAGDMIKLISRIILDEP